MSVELNRPDLMRQGVMKKIDRALDRYASTLNMLMADPEFRDLFFTPILLVVGAAVVFGFLLA